MLSCQVRAPEWIYTLQLPERHGTPPLKQARYLKLDNNGIRTQNHLSG